MTKKHRASFRFHRHTAEHLAALAELTGLSRTTVLEQLIACAYDAHAHGLRTPRLVVGPTGAGVRITVQPLPKASP